MVIITGTQRAGTSFLANYLHKMGYDLGNNKWDEDADGGYESPSICKYYRDTIPDPIFPFSNFYEQTKDMDCYPIDRIGLYYEVQKFSFMLMNPKFVDMWVDARGTNDKFIILMRWFPDVIKSKNRTEKQRLQFDKDSKLLKFDATELKNAFYASMERILHHGIEHRLLVFPFFLNNYAMTREVLVSFAKLRSLSPVWNKLVDPSRIHIK